MPFLEDVVRKKKELFLLSRITSKVVEEHHYFPRGGTYYGCIKSIS